MANSDCPDLQLRSDEPIEALEQDALNRRDLAQSIASKILSRSLESCLVVGVSGPWGSGKSSLLNLIDNHLSEEKKKRSILILRFNPWRHSKIEELIAAFFGEIRQVVGLVDKKELAKNISDAVDRMATALLALSAIPALQPAAVVALGVKGGTKAVQSLIREDSLEKIKSDLNGYLEQAGVHLVILIDDLDRAEPECVRLMLQMLRMNADFSSTTYVLAYDRERTARALSSSLRMRRNDGRDYLDKLVQVPFDLPITESLRLKVEVVDAANPLFELIVNDPELNRHHSEVTNAGFYDLFDSVRDAKRFANALAITLPLVWDEVNAVDFAVLEAIRLRFPLLYERLHEHRWLLLNEPRGLEEAVEDYILRDKKPDREGHQKTLDELLELAGAEGTGISKLLETLFPQLTRLRYEHSPWSLPFNESWSRQCLVCSAAHFDSYFYLAPGVQAVSEAELREALELARNGDQVVLAQMLVEFDKRAKGTTLMRRFSMRSRGLASDQIETVIGAFLNVSSEPARWGHPAQDPKPMLQIGQFMQIMISTIECAEEQLAMIRRCIKTGTGLCGVVRFTSAVLDIQQISEDDAKKQAVMAEASQRLHAAATDGDLLSSPCSSSLLYSWLEWDPEQTKAYVRSLVQDGETLLQLLNSLQRTAGRYSDASGYEEPSARILPKILNYIVDVEVVEQAAETARQVLEDTVDAQEAEILRGFIEGASKLDGEGEASEEKADV